MKDIFGLRHPLLQPIWRRVVLVLFTFVWAWFEDWQGSTVWAGFFVVLGTYLAIFWTLDTLRGDSRNE